VIRDYSAGATGVTLPHQRLTWHPAASIRLHPVGDWPTPVAEPKTTLAINSVAFADGWVITSGGGPEQPAVVVAYPAWRVIEIALQPIPTKQEVDRD